MRFREFQLEQLTGLLGCLQADTIETLKYSGIHKLKVYSKKTE